MPPAPYLPRFSVPHFFVMTYQYESLITGYRVLAKKRQATDWIAYFLGVLLLIAPLVPSLALPLAVFSLSYFALVFTALAAWDLGKKISLGLEIKLTVLVREVGYYLDGFKRLARNLFALSRALAL